MAAATTSREPGAPLSLVARTRGMGRHFESYNATWVERYIEDVTGNAIDIKMGKTFQDPENIVNEKSEQFELDIYFKNDDTLIIGEATTFLEQDEFDKVKVMEILGS